MIVFRKPWMFIITLMFMALLIAFILILHQTPSVSKVEEMENICAACIKEERAKIITTRDPWVYFVRFYDEKNKKSDPSDAFIARFKGSNPRIAKGSEGILINNGMAGVQSRTTHEQGAFASFSSLTWVSPTEVTVSYYYYCSSLGAGHSTFTLDKVDGEWKVTAEKQGFVS